MEEGMTIAKANGIEWTQLNFVHAVSIKSALTPKLADIVL